MKYVILLVLLFSLAACGQGVEKRSGSQEKDPLQAYETSPEGDAISIVQDFIETNLDELSYSGLYLEEGTKVILLVQEDFLTQELEEMFSEFLKENKIEAMMKAATYSYETLNSILSELNKSYEDLLVNQRQTLSFGINEIENRVDLYVSTKTDLNLALLEDITNGDDQILHIEEGIMSSVDENGIPTADPYIVGKIKEITTEPRILVEDQIYFTINDTTIIIDQDGNAITETDLQEGDEVVVWTDGAISFSLPAQGYAVVIQVRNAE